MASVVAFGEVAELIFSNEKSYSKRPSKGIVLLKPVTNFYTVFVPLVTMIFGYLSLLSSNTVSADDDGINELRLFSALV